MNALMPKGTLEICKAAPIYREGKLISKGSKTARVCFDDLPDEAYRIPGSLTGCCRWGSLPFSMDLKGNREYVWLNLESLKKRFHLSEKVIRSASLSDDLYRIVQIAKDRLSFQVPQNPPAFSESKEDIPMLSRENIQLISLQDIASQAVNQKRGIKLSKQIFNISQSIEITKEGYVAILSKSRIGKGGHAVVKKATSSDNTPIVRRVCNQGELYERLFQNMQRFKGKKGCQLLTKT